jgi:2'-5' RNA ligase
VRLFVAFELPAIVRERIARRVADLRGRLPAASWVPAERLHLTLAFLGDVDAARLEPLAAALTPVFGGCPRLRLRLGGAGTFPPDRPARVAWIAVESDAPTDASTACDLEALEGAVRRAIAAVLRQALDGRPYHAHVTVARPRRPWARSAASTFRLECAEIAGEWDAERAVLMESRLGSGGARYSVVQEYALAGRSA